MSENTQDFDIRKLVKRERHAEVFDWLCKALGKAPDQLASEILTAALVKELPTYRESQGGGGGSSRDLEALAARLR